MKSQENKATEGEPERRRVLDDPKERVLFRTRKIVRPEANINDGGNRGVREQQKGSGRKNVAKRVKMTGLSKNKWSREERQLLWECFLRSGGKRSGGYIQKVKDLWDDKGMNARSIASLLSQLKQIETNSLLTVAEWEEIERMIREDGLTEKEVTGDMEGENADRDVDFRVVPGEESVVEDKSGECVIGKEKRKIGGLEYQCVWIGWMFRKEGMK